MPSSTTELIKSKLDVVEFLRGYVTLTPAGKNFRGLCPFHHEKTPSFMVSPERQSWHCFGCGLGGDIFTFCMRHENIEFGEAMRALAEKAGVELKHENPAEYKYSGLLYDLNDAAKNFFKKALAAAPVAQKYLAERGLKKEAIEEFEIGWAPNEPEGLSMFFLNTGTAPQDLLQAGLSIKTERGLTLDRFRGRIMFPIHNHMGKVVGFTGRILPQLDHGDMGKYVNSPETPIFQKSKILYGFWKSKDAIREKKSAVLVEGQMDFLMSFQSGVKNVIASSGTALTADHLRTLHRFTEEIVLSFDNDTAGSDAAERAIALAEANDFSVKIATFIDFKDAADAAQADPENVRKTFVAAVPAPEFYFKKYLPALASASAGKPADAAAVSSRDGLLKLRTVLEKLKNITSPVLRDFWMKELSRRTGIGGKVLQEEAEKISITSVPDYSKKSDETETQKRPIARRDLIAERLFAAALVKSDFALFDDCADYLAPPQKEILRILKSGARRSEDPLLDEEIGIIVLRASNDVSDGEIKTLKAELIKEYVKERRNILALAIKNAEANGNEVELNAALEELRNLPSGNGN
jgi:DNA primase